MAYSILLPSNDQYAACCKINLHFRETLHGFALPDGVLESAQKKLDFSPPLYHYICRNFRLVEFAYTMSVLANAK